MVSHFIDDYERHGRYTGFPSVGIEWQKMESPVLRSALGMKVRSVHSAHSRGEGVGCVWQMMKSPMLCSALGTKVRSAAQHAFVHGDTV